MGLFGGIATSAGGTNQTALGLYQLWRAKKVKEDKYVPPSLQQNINEAEGLARKTKYTGQDYDESQVRRASSNAFSNAKESTGSAANLLNAGGAIQSRENDAMNKIGQKALQFQEVNRNNAQNLRGQRANFEYDSKKRYWAAKSALKGAAIQNIMQGQASIHQGAGSFLDSMFSMMGGMGGGAAGGAGGSFWQNNPMTMSPQASPNQQNPINQSNPNYNQYPNGLYS